MTLKVKGRLNNGDCSSHALQLWRHKDLEVTTEKIGPSSCVRIYVRVKDAFLFYYLSFPEENIEAPRIHKHDPRYIAWERCSEKFTKVGFQLR